MERLELDTNMQWYIILYVSEEPNNVNAFKS